MQDAPLFSIFRLQKLFPRLSIDAVKKKTNIDRKEYFSYITLWDIQERFS